MRVIPIVGVLLICAIAAVRGDEDPLTAATDLYASAAYEEALVALARIDASVPSIARVVDQYRASCLFALGRRAEAEEVAELLIQREPLLQLEGAAPRIEAMFQDVRKRLLPGLIRAEYKTAKAAIDDKEQSRANRHLIAARNLIDEAEEIGVTDERLADLGLLVDGFFDLVNRAVVEQERSAPPTTSRTSLSSEPTAAKSELATKSSAVLAVYGDDDAEVVPPSVVKQPIPQLPANLARFVTTRPARGVLEVIIDESGIVQRSTLRQSLHPSYDAMVVDASRGWRYTPATKDGVPVKFRRTIMITLR